MSVELYNTRVDEGPFEYSHAIIAGLAPEQGLFTPNEIPRLGDEEIREMASMPYAQMAARVIDRFSDLPAELTHAITTEAYSADRFKRQEHAPTEVTPYVHLDDGIGVVELFHGPTYSFKDVALQIVPKQMDYVLGQRGDRLTIVGATSGDTGSAAIDGVLGTENMNIVMLSPPNMALAQKGQIGQRTGEQALNLMVDGVFDDCQDLVKELNDEPGFDDLGALNSINWARIVAQVPYYFSTYYQTIAQQGLEFGQPIDVIVPSGNFGNALAAYIARDMGVPIRHVVLATNENDVLHKMVQTGVYDIQPSSAVHPTDAPSMDIGKASNFERLAYWAFDRDVEKVNDFLAAASADGGANLGDYVSNGDDDTLQNDHNLRSHTTSRSDRQKAMRRAHDESGVFVDPHTATALHAAYTRKQRSRVPQIVMATASIHKFEPDVQEMLGPDAVLPERPQDLQGVEQYADRFERIPNDINALMAAVSAFRNR